MTWGNEENIIFLPKRFFVKKSVLFWKLNHVSQNARTVLRVTYIKTISQNKKRKSDAEFWNLNQKWKEKNVLFPKCKDNVIWLQFSAEKDAIDIF